MGCTWVGWSYPGCGGSGALLNVSDDIKSNPSVIKKYGGYGVDGDGDGKASMWNIADAIMSTANYMNKSGFSTNRDAAIRRYNHSDSYVALINKKAQEFENAATYTDSGGGSGPANDLGFVAPTVGRITSSWGDRYLGNTPNFHAALDIANSSGTNIYVVADGTVTYVQTGCPPSAGIGKAGSQCGFTWGNHIRVTHVIKGVTYETIYAHLSKVNVSANTKVKSGQIIGKMGTSGNSSGPHLHIELHQPKRSGNNNALNPLYYLPPIQKN